MVPYVSQGRCIGMSWMCFGTYIFCIFIHKLLQDKRKLLKVHNFNFCSMFWSVAVLIPHAVLGSANMAWRIGWFLGCMQSCAFSRGVVSSVFWFSFQCIGHWSVVDPVRKVWVLSHSKIFCNRYDISAESGSLELLPIVCSSLFWRSNRFSIYFAYI